MSYAAYDDDSTTRSLMQLKDALALDPLLSTNALSHEERTALRRSDRKAGQILGVTLTRDVKAHDMQDFGVGRTPLAVLQPPRVPQADSFMDAVQNIHLGSLMAAVGAKRARSREFSAITLVGALKDLGANMRLDKLGRKKRCVGGMYSKKVALDESQVDKASISSGSEMAGHEDTDSDASSMQSFIELDEQAYVITPTYADFHDSFDEYDDEEEEEEFEWDVYDPFSEPKNPEGHKILHEYFAKLRLRESISPLDLCKPTEDSVPFVPLPESAYSPSSSRRSSCSLEPSIPDPNALGYLRAFDAAETEERARRKQKRDTLRSRLKKLAILGDEARLAVDGETIQ